MPGIEFDEVCVGGKELMLPDLLQLPVSVVETLVALPGNLHRVLPPVLATPHPV